MPTLADIRAKLPDLEGLDDEQAISVIQQVYYPTVPVEQIAARLGYKPASSAALPERTKWAAVGDTAIETVNAAIGGIGSIGSFVAPGNPVSEFIDAGIVKPLQERQSDRKKAINARLAQDIAGAQGVGDQVGAALRYAKDDPAGLLGMAAGSFAIPLGAIKGAGMLAKSLGVVDGAATKAALAGGALTGAALSGGDAAGQAYEESLKAGATEEQAQAAARQASVIPAIVGGAGGMLPGAERIVAGAKGFAGNAISRALKTGASEGAQEFGEEFATQYEANRAVAPYDGRDPMQGAVAAGTLGALAGAPIGMLTGAVSPRREDEPKKPAPTPEQKAAKVLAAGSVDEAIKAATDATSGKATGGGLDRLRGILPDEQRREVIGLMATANNPNSPPNVRRFAEQQIDAILREYTDIPTADVVEESELLPTPDATELTDEQRAAYVNAPSNLDRLRLRKPIPTGEATDAIPAADAQEIEPIPAGDASEEIPAPDAYEAPPVGEATEVIPTGDAMEVPRIPTGKATEIEPEVVEPTDLTTTDGMPYGSKTAANVRARREGLGPANVVEIPGAGWVVRPQPKTLGPEPIQAQPAGTRGTNAGDVVKAAPKPADSDAEENAFRTGDFKAMLRLRKERQAKERAAAGDLNDGGILKHQKDDRWVMVLPDVEGAGKWRIQRFDKRGFSGHMVFNSRDEAIEAALGEGFKVRDDAAMDAMQDTPEFQRGNFAADLIRRLNGNEITREEADRQLAEYDAPKKAPDDANPARPAGPRPADPGRSDGAGVLPVVQPGDVAAGAAAPSGQGAAGGGAAGPGAGGRDEALSAKRATAIDAFKRVKSAKFPGRDHQQSAEMMADRLLPMIEAKSADGLIGMNLGSADMNPGSRAAFEAVTGIKLPKGRAATERAIDEWAGISEQKRAEKNAARKAEVDAKAADRDLQGAKRAAAAIQVKNGERLVDGAAWVDELMERGFTSVVRRGPKTFLANSAGEGWQMMHKDIAEYARRKAATPNAAAPAEKAPAQGRVPEAAAPTVGMRFFHRRVLDSDNKPMEYRVTRVANGVVYYAPVDGGKSEKTGVDEFDRVVGRLSEQASPADDYKARLTAAQAAPPPAKQGPTAEGAPTPNAAAPAEQAPEQSRVPEAAAPALDSEPRGGVMWQGREFERETVAALRESLAAKLADHESELRTATLGKKRGDSKVARALRQNVEATRALLAQADKALAGAAQEARLAPAQQNLQDRLSDARRIGKEAAERGDPRDPPEAFTGMEKQVWRAGWDQGRKIGGPTPQVPALDAAEKPRKTLQEGRTDAALDRQVRENGEITTRRQWVERKVAEGLKTRITQEDRIKPMSRMAYFRATNEEQREHERKIKAGGKKDVYWIGDYEVTKIEHDYANQLAAAPAPAQAPTPTLADRIKQRRGEKAAAATEAPKSPPVSPATATHKDPGQPAEPATAPVIAQALSKAAVKEALSRSAMKAEALRLVDAAIAAAPSSAEVDALIRISGPITSAGKKELSGVRTFGENSDDQSIQVKARETRDGKWTVTNDSFDGSGTGRKVGTVLGELVGTPAVARDQLMTLLRNLGPDGKVGKTDTVVIKVPGDGEFRVVNTRERLAEFRKKVEASPGFKDQRTTGLPPNRVNGYGMKVEPGVPFGVETGSGPKSEAFANMIEDGDIQAALDYAATVGIDPKTAKLPDKLRQRLDMLMTEGVTRTAAAAPAAPAPAPQPEVDAAPAAEPAAEAKVAAKFFVIDRGHRKGDESVVGVFDTKAEAVEAAAGTLGALIFDGNTGRVLDGRGNKRTSRDDIGESMAYAFRTGEYTESARLIGMEDPDVAVPEWRKTVADKKAESARSDDSFTALDNDAHRAALEMAVKLGKPVPAEVLDDYPDLKQSAPAPVRDERTIELRKRASVLRSLRECLG